MVIFTCSSFSLLEPSSIKNFSDAESWSFSKFLSWSVVNWCWLATHEAASASIVGKEFRSQLDVNGTGKSSVQKAVFLSNNFNSEGIFGIIWPLRNCPSE
ncbi:hypothetical protein COP2_026180 [Malus domestica]